MNGEQYSEVEIRITTGNTTTVLRARQAHEIIYDIEELDLRLLPPGQVHLDYPHNTRNVQLSFTAYADAAWVHLTITEATPK